MVPFSTQYFQEQLMDFNKRNYIWKMYGDEFEPRFDQFQGDLKYGGMFQQLVTNQAFQEVKFLTTPMGDSFFVRG